LLKPDSLGSFIFDIVPMRNSYLAVLLTFPIFISSYFGDRNPFLANPDDPKVTHLYPNPATTYINFSFDKSVDKTYILQIYSFMGKKMNETRITDAKLTITFDENYYRGIYVYQLRDQSGRIVESGKFQVIK
jgi:hypothetical protein